ncbi:MAG: hypothetical protein ACXWNU_06560 [Candidatus Binataceae bacterium]
MGGANHVLIDIPLGPSAKVRTLAEAERLGGLSTRSPIKSICGRC